MKNRRKNRPNIKEKAEQIREDNERFVRQQLQPYLIHLLNKVQARLKHPIGILVGNGTWYISYPVRRQRDLLNNIFFTGICLIGY
jgi:hypothetical protein